MNKTTVWSIIISLTLILGLAGAIALVRTSQENRSSAAFATGSLTLLPSPIGNVNVGEEAKVHLSVNGGDKKVNGLQTVICYGNQLDIVDPNTNIAPGTNFDLILAKKTQVNGKTCVDLAVGAKTSATLSSGVVEVAVITLKGITAGTGQVEALTDKTIVSGENPGSTDNQITMGSVNNTTYTVVSSGAIGTGTISIIPSTGNTLNIGNEEDMSILVDGSGKKVNGVQTVVCYGPQLDVTDANVKVQPSANFDLILAKKIQVNGKNCIDLTVGAKTSATLTTGPTTVATIAMKGVTAGLATIEILGDKTVVSGENPGSTANQIAMSTVNNAAVTVVNSTTKIFNFKVSFQGVTQASQCADNMPVSVIVLSVGNTYVYSNVALTKTTENNANGLAVYAGNVPLNNVTLPATDVAVFIKGPKHLQMKYGIDGQTAFYNKSGGEIAVSNDPNDGKVYNFQNYPVLAGDVIGVNNSNQDGIVDGVDFNFVKTRAITRDTVNNGGNMVADLDGSCQVNSADVTTLMLSLKEKQAQLY